VGIQFLPTDDVPRSLRQVVLAEKVGEAVLELAAGIGGVGGLLDQRLERLRAPARGVLDDPDDLVDVEDPQSLSALPGAAERTEVSGAGEVEERPFDGGNR
jgi:hypothetical protein